MSTLLLTWYYLRFHPWRSLALCLCLGISASLPLALHRITGEYQRDLTARAAVTPLVVGARGNRYDLVLKALYFSAHAPDPIHMGTVDAIRDTGWATVVPLNLAFTAGRHPLVGTTYDYFELRGLHPASGTLPLSLGDAVLGANAAAALGLGPGDALLTDQADVFDLAAAYPLRLHIVGVLAPTGGPDDDAVFADIKTAWVVAGIGHGHTDVATAPPAAGLTLPATSSDNVVASATDNVVASATDNVVASATDNVVASATDNVVASAAVTAYTEITADNLASFHFHGDPETFPVTAALVLPTDTRAGTLLRGRFSISPTEQLLVPSEVVDELLGMVVRLQRYIDAIFAAVGVTVVAFLILVLGLSWRLREREVETLYKLGCGRGTLLGLRLAEVGLLLLGGGLCTLLLTALVLRLAPNLLELL